MGKWSEFLKPSVTPEWAATVINDYANKYEEIKERKGQAAADKYAEKQNPKVQELLRRSGQES